jgi:hypothetical protein
MSGERFPVRGLNKLVAWVFGVSDSSGSGN